MGNACECSHQWRMPSAGNIEILSQFKWHAQFSRAFCFLRLHSSFEFLLIGRYFPNQSTIVCATYLR